MGPIFDIAGVEQGGCLSMDHFQLVNNEELTVTTSSGLGLQIGPVHVASIGIADDVALLSPSIFGLQSLLNLSSQFCSKMSQKMIIGSLLSH